MAQQPRAKAKKVLVAKGVSSTGTVHQLEIETVQVPGNRIMYDKYKFTVLGPTGKRHASVILDAKDKDAIRKFLEEN